MAYDEGLATRLHDVFADRPDITEKKMFGGLCFLHSGNMCVGILKEDLVLRVGTENYESLLEKDFAREMDFTGRSMKGMIYVAPEGFEDDSDLVEWIDHALDFTSSLPNKF